MAKPDTPRRIVYVTAYEAIAILLSSMALALVYALSSPSTLNGETDFSILALIKGTAS